MSHIRIAILTCEREPAYIYQTISSLFDAEPFARNISFVIDSDNKNYLREHADAYDCYYLNESEADELDGYPLTARCCNTCWRALKMDCSEYRGLLVCEDDIIFRPDFLTYLEQSIDEFESSYTTCTREFPPYMMSLHSKFDIAKEDKRRPGQYYLITPAHKFYGMHAIYYSQSIITTVRDYMWEFGVLKQKLPADLLLGKLGYKMQSMYNTAYDLVEHIGRVSTGLSDEEACYGESATFTKPWRPLV